MGAFEELATEGSNSRFGCHSHSDPETKEGMITQSSVIVIILVVEFSRPNDVDPIRLFSPQKPINACMEKEEKWFYMIIIVLMYRTKLGIRASKQET